MEGYLVMLRQDVKLDIAPPLPGVVTQRALVQLGLLVVDHVLPLDTFHLSCGYFSPLQNLRILQKV